VAGSQPAERRNFSRLICKEGLELAWSKEKREKKRGTAALLIIIKRMRK
jgi:hypothetical protein